MSKRNGIRLRDCTILFWLVVLLGTASLAQAQTTTVLYLPEDIDSRLFVDGSSLTESRVSIWSPYNYASRNVHEGQQLERFAVWMCDLWERTPVYFGRQASDTTCDEKGAAAAERDSNCFHIHYFACALRK